MRLFAAVKSKRHRRKGRYPSQIDTEKTTSGTSDFTTDRPVDDGDTGDGGVRIRRPLLTSLAENGEICVLLASYIGDCRRPDGGKASERIIPNVAGFCRYAGCGLYEFEQLRNNFPDIYGSLCAVLEDEALNSSMPASVLSVYLKLRLGYAGESKSSSSSTAVDAGQIRLIFDHDAYTDGG